MQQYSKKKKKYGYNYTNQFLKSFKYHSTPPLYDYMCTNQMHSYASLIAIQPEKIHAICFSRSNNLDNLSITTTRHRHVMHSSIIPICTINEFRSLLSRIA